MSERKRDERGEKERERGLRGERKNEGDRGEKESE